MNNSQSAVADIEALLAETGMLRRTLATRAAQSAARILDGMESLAHDIGSVCLEINGFTTLHISHLGPRKSGDYRYLLSDAYGSIEVTRQTALNKLTGLRVRVIQAQERVNG